MNAFIKIKFYLFQEILGTDSLFYYDIVLPHFPKRDIILTYNQETKQLEPPKEKLQEIEKGKLKYAPRDGNKWFIMFPGGTNMLTRNTFKSTGILKYFVRQIEYLGYTPIMVSYLASFYFIYFQLNFLF